VSDELKYKDSGDIRVNVEGIRGWLGGGAYQPGAHILKMLGYNHGEAATGTKMLNYVFSIIDGPDGDVGRVYNESMAYLTDGGKGMMRGIAEALNPTCIKKGEKDGKAYELISMDNLKGFTATVDFVEEEYMDKKKQVKTRCGADWTTIRDVTAPGAESGGGSAEDGPSDDDLDGI